jgi:hypothetical protein
LNVYLEKNTVDVRKFPIPNYLETYPIKAASPRIMPAFSRVEDKIYYFGGQSPTTRINDVWVLDTSIN